MRTNLSLIYTVWTIIIVITLHLSNLILGEIAIYTVGDNTRWKSFVINEPYDVFGTWLNNNFFISGNFQFAEPDYISTVSELWATSAVEQETLVTDSEAEIVANKRVSLCRIINKNSSSVRSIAENSSAVEFDIPPSMKT